MMLRVLTASMLLLAQAAVPGRVQKKGAVMEGEQLIRIWLNAADRASVEGYVPVSDFNALPARVRGDTSLWLERFLTREADPQHRTSGVQVSVHPSTPDSPDLLRYEYELHPWRLIVVESNNFALIRVGPTLPANASQAHLRELIESAAKSILNMKDAAHSWTFQFPAQIAEGTIFSTQPAADPLLLPQWTDRADGCIHKGSLYFLCYKKVLELAGYEDIKHWFPADFRERLR